MVHKRFSTELSHKSHVKKRIGQPCAIKGITELPGSDFDVHTVNWVILDVTRNPRKPNAGLFVKVGYLKYAEDMFADFCYEKDQAMLKKNYGKKCFGERGPILWVYLSQVLFYNEPLI